MRWRALCRGEPIGEPRPDAARGLRERSERSRSRRQSRLV